MDHARAGRGISAVLAACVLLLALAGCASGDAVQGSFEREFGDDPAVVRLDLSTADNMPFTGGVGGTVTVRDELDEEQLRGLVGRIVSFRGDTAGDEDESRVRIDVVASDWTFPVLATQESSAAVLDAVFELRADPRVRSGTFISTDYQNDLDHVTLIAASTSEIAGLILDAPAIAAAGGKTPSITVRSPEDGGSAVEVSGRLGAWASDAVRAYETLRAQVPVTAFRAEEAAVSVTLADEGDVDAARTIVAEILDPTSTTVFYQSNLVTLSPGANGNEARGILDELDERARASVASVWTDDRSLTLTATSVGAVEHLAGAVSRSPGAAEVPVRIAVGQGDDTVFRLASSAGDLRGDTETAMRLMRTDGVEAVRVNPGTVLEVDFDSAPSERVLVGTAVPLKALSEFDERLCITWPAGSFCTRTAQVIDASDLGEMPGGRAFADAWNAAP
ncbi:hypothetical protein ACFVWL_03590 [Microbacterium sp. NPDC058269]|uniref:hypothetical protein n=1 Tax=Microbacterium sp. NPDC058269 TaxID=3346414 RepID=UPI0036DECA3F